MNDRDRVASFVRAHADLPNARLDLPVPTEPGEQLKQTIVIDGGEHGLLQVTLAKQGEDQWTVFFDHA